MIFLYSVYFGDNSAKIAMFSFLGLILPWLFFNIILSRSRKYQLIVLIAVGPLISVVLGAGLELLGYWDVVRNEYTGAVRVQGASIPAHFAFLCFNGALASSILLILNKRFALLLLIMNCGFVVLSGTRMTMGLVSILMCYLLLNGHLRVAKNLLLFVFTSILFVLFVFEYASGLYGRTFEGVYSLNNDYGINDSGRLEAWAIFLDLAMDNVWFGSGLGSSILPYQDGLTHFGVPHNEYIRFFYEGGFFGLLVVVLCVFFLHRRVYRLSQQNLKSLVLCSGVLFALYSITDNSMSTLQSTIPYALILSALKEAA